MASLTSSSLYGSPVSLSCQASSSSSSRSSSSLQVLCQQSKEVGLFEQRAEKLPRRSFGAAILLAVLAESYSAQEAQAARKKPAETEKKPEEDKSLSVYDAKLLATYRRKEAMKEEMAKLKERGKTAQKKSPLLEPSPASKSESVNVPEAKLEDAPSVAASATEAVKEAVESLVPSSE